MWTINKVDSMRPRTGKEDFKSTFFANSSALCLALLETDLSESNLARRNSIVIELESSMSEVFLCWEMPA